VKDSEYVIRNVGKMAVEMIEEKVANGTYENMAVRADIEKEMKKCAKEGKYIVRKEISKAEALEMFKDDEYKLDLINDLEDGKITIYEQGDFTDLCCGPHVENTKLCKNFKLVKHSGAYWKGDAENKMLQRVYGVCFPTAEELEAHLKELEEAKERDHRKIGKEMQLFMTDDLIGRGLPMFLPKGYTIWRELENYIRDKELALGYDHVLTPCVGTVDLYKTSGHWEHYKENMFPAMEVEDETFVLRPMNCPHHMMIYANRPHSYKELPIRIGEIAHDFRFEASGTLKGIERGRHFCQNDAHLFVTPDQIKSEVASVVQLIKDVYKDFNITDYRCVLSLRDPADTKNYHQDDEMWNKAENALREVLNDLKIDYTEEIGEAAFYGPKLDINVKPAVGNEYTLSTCQLDFCLPMKFNLTYIDADGLKKTPVVLHRAILGSLDRFMAYILEETRGNLPLWLAPVQVKVLPVKNDDAELCAYAEEVNDLMYENHIRVEYDDRSEKLGYKMREAQIQKIPYILVLGNNEKEARTVTFRLHGKQESVTVPVDEFIKKIKDDITTKKYDL
ncbi:MAG: threonine--tRNA ligase, partial [Lachnospiraceae bacterium]|nr:threonine--tRNA ligase [Lachnospiraceae bacterium]